MMVYADSESPKSAKIVFYLVIAVFVIGALVTMSEGTFQSNHTVSDDAYSLFDSFRSLVQGDIQGFFDNIIDGLPIIAMFFILFSIVHFLMTTVMKPIFPNRKVATMLAVVIAIYCFINQKIYNLMLSLNSFTIAFLVFGALVIMLWGFGKSTIPDSKKQFDEISKQKNLNAQERKKLKEYLDKKK